MFNDFEELSKLCVLGGKHSAMCLLRSAWLREKREEVRIGAPFVLPSRNKLPPEAVYSGRIAKDSTFIIVLSYCWASAEHPDPENKLLDNVCEFLAYLDVSRHFGKEERYRNPLSLTGRCSSSGTGLAKTRRRTATSRRCSWTVSSAVCCLSTTSTATWEPCAFCAPRDTIRPEADLTTRGRAGHTLSPSFPPS